MRGPPNSMVIPVDQPRSRVAPFRHWPHPAFRGRAPSPTPDSPFLQKCMLVHTQINLPCPADFDGDGFLTGDDFDVYVAAFEAGSIDADFDGDGFVTGDDFDAFVIAFEAGC